MKPNLLPSLLFSMHLRHRILPFDLMEDEITCEIDNGSGSDCRVFFSNLTSSYSNYTSENCTVDLKFNYTFTNVGLACVSIATVSANIAPLGTQQLDFNDIYSFQEREICNGEAWTVPDKRTSVDLCEVSQELDPSWDIVVDIEDFNRRIENITFAYRWNVSPTMSPQPSIAPIDLPSIEPSVAPYAQPSVAPSSKPSIAASSHPSSSPTEDLCQDCTLTGYIGAGKTRVSTISLFCLFMSTVFFIFALIVTLLT